MGIENKLEYDLKLGIVMVNYSDLTDEEECCRGRHTFGEDETNEDFYFGEGTIGYRGKKALEVLERLDSRGNISMGVEVLDNEAFERDIDGTMEDSELHRIVTKKGKVSEIVYYLDESSTKPAKQIRYKIDENNLTVREHFESPVTIEVFDFIDWVRAGKPKEKIAVRLNYSISPQ